MVWTYSGITDLLVDIVDRVANISVPDSEWSGSESITFRATDPEGLFDEDAALFTVTPVNDPPVILARIQALDPTLPVVVMTAWGSIELAVEAMRREH